MQLKELVHHLTDLVWSAEQRMQRPMEDAVLAYVHDAVVAEIEYRRRMHDLGRRLAEIEGIQEVTTQA